MSPVSRVIALIVPLLLLLGDPAAVAAKPRPSKHRRAQICAIPRGGHLVAQDAQIRLITTIPAATGSTEIKEEWDYCVRARHRRFHPLVDAALYYDGYGDIVDVGPVVLSGRFAAYNTETTASGGRYGNNPVGEVTVRDLLTDNNNSARIDCNMGTLTTSEFCALGPTDYYCSAPFCDEGPPALILTSDGLASWVSEQKCIYGVTANAWRSCAWSVQMLDGRTGWQEVLDRLQPTFGSYPPDPFGNLRLYKCTAGCSSVNQPVAAWTDNGVWLSASVQ